MASKSESPDPQKPSPREQELQPMAEPNDAVTRDITGEEHPNPAAVRQPDTGVYLRRGSCGFLQKINRRGAAHAEKLLLPAYRNAEFP